MTSGKQRDRTAVAISIALHVCAWTLLALALRPIFPAPVPEDRITIARLLRVDRPAERPAPLQPTPRVPAAPLPALHVAPAHVRRRLIVADEQRYVLPARRAAPNAALPAPAGAPVTAADEVATAVASSVPSPVPVDVVVAPARTDAATAAGSEGVGNFGETYEAALLPEARAALVAGVASGFVVRIKVDENGHAIEVAFLRGPDDPAVRELIRQRLFAARFIHAVSNGLPAAGTIELRT